MDRRRRAPRLRSIALDVLAVAIVVALVLGIGPQAFAGAARNFDPVDAPVVAALCLAWYVLQGVRWHPLLRDRGSRPGMGDTIVVNLAGQSVGPLPGGEMARAVLAGEAGQVVVLLAMSWFLARGLDPTASPRTSWPGGGCASTR